MEVWRTSGRARCAPHFPKLGGPRSHGYVIRCIIDRAGAGRDRHERGSDRRGGVKTAEDVRRQPMPLIRYSRTAGREPAAAEISLRESLLPPAGGRGEPARVRDAAGCLQRLSRRPANARRNGRAARGGEGLQRTVCDYLSGMTDGYLVEEHARLFPASSAGTGAEEPDQ